MALRDYLVGEVAQDFADGLLTRRDALRRLGLLGLGLAGASTLLAACADGGDGGDGGDGVESGGDRNGDSATTTSSAAATKLPAEAIRFAGASGELQAAYAAPTTGAVKGSLLVIHENRGLTPHFHDLVGRLAGEGFAALCVDLVSPEGGTSSLGDEGAAAAALAAAPTSRLVGDLRAGIGELQRRNAGTKVGVVGFCFGGGMTWQLLQEGDERVAAAIPFYGPAPDKPDFRNADAAVLAVYAGSDTRVNASRDRAEEALKAAGLTHEVRVFQGADHAFFNDTGARYDAEASAAAYTLLLEWFTRYLA